MTTPATIIICRADEVVANVAKLKPVAVLSIEHPEAKPEQTGSAPRLTDGTPQMILNFFDYPFENGPGGPDIEQVEQGLAFIMDSLAKAKGGNVIIHCALGKSRSVGMALGVLSQLYPRESEAALIKRLVAIRPEAAPNILVVEMVDKLTGRKGKLLQAVLDDPKITAARETAAASRAAWIKKNGFEDKVAQGKTAKDKPKGNTP